MTEKIVVPPLQLIVSVDPACRVGRPRATTSATTSAAAGAARQPGRLRRVGMLGFALVGMFVASTVELKAQDASEDQPPVREEFSQEHLSDLTAKIRAEAKLIGLAAMITVDGKVVASAVDGERKKDSGNKLDIGDCWHIGSITKSITATMIARLVERKQIEWATTVGDCLGDSIEIHADCLDINLEQLLTHTSGVTANFPITTQFQRPPEGKQRVKARKAAVAGILGKKPTSQPGESFRYSNVGFTIAAVMVEQKTGKSWEDLVRQEVFVPLKLTQAGFGPPKDRKGTLDQPRGHRSFGPFKRSVRETDDNSPIMGPAGFVHMTLSEMCAYGNEHMVGERGKGKLLKGETYKSLHTPRLNGYAFGWLAPENHRSAEDRIIWHNGSNTMWYAMLAFLPERNAVIAVTSNDGDIKRAEAAAFQIVKAFAKSK